MSTCVEILHAIDATPALVDFHTGLDDDAAHAADVPLKFDAARTLFDRYLEPRFRNALGAPPDQYEVITPKLFQHHLFTKARRDPKRIVRPCVDITFQAPHAIDATCFRLLTVCSHRCYRKVTTGEVVVAPVSVREESRGAHHPG